MSKDTALSRGELGIRMLCAWNNIPRDKAPASWSEHHNVWTREAWARVAEAAIRHHLETHPPDKALDGISVKALEWGEVEKPNQIVSYDHVHAPSSIGGYLVTWKSWKSYPSFTVERDGDFIDTASSLEDAKAFAQADFDQRIRSALAVR